MFPLQRQKRNTSFYVRPVSKGSRPRGTWRAFFVTRLHDEFHDVPFDMVDAKDVEPALRGQHGVALIKLVEVAFS